MLDMNTVPPEQRELIYDRAEHSLRNAMNGCTAAEYDVLRYMRMGLYKVNRPEEDRDYEC